MERGLYQLVAISNNGIEYVIELNNENKNNKSKLEFIDSGTTRFKDSMHLANYLYNNGKLPTKDVSFAIKYKHNVEKYIPLVFNDKRLYALSKNKPESDFYQDYIFYLFKSIQIELNHGFYNYLISVNNKNSRQKSNGNYLNSKLLTDISMLYNNYIKINNQSNSKLEFVHSIVKELFNYKQLRTMHIMYIDYCNSKHKKQEYNIEAKINSTKGITFPDYEYVEIPENINYTYEKDGMDGVYGIADLDDLEKLGIKLK